MPVINGAMVGLIETVLILKIWKWYGINVLKMRTRMHKIISICALILSVTLNYLLFSKEINAVIRINMIVFFVLLSAIAAIDYKNKIIPNKLLLIGIVSRTVILVIEAICYSDMIKKNLLNALMGLLFGLIFMLVLCWISKHGIGFGDVKLFAWVGYCMGVVDTYSILFYSALLAAIAGIYLMVLKKEDRKRQIPFAPFVWIGAYSVLCMRLLS